MDTTLIVSALLSTIISAVISYRIANNKNVKSEEARLNEQILELNKIVIKYPYLEDDDFCKTWPDNRYSKEEKYLRYDSYCCIVFNLLEQIYKLYKGNEDKMENFFYVKELIRRHKYWWISTFENIDGYNSNFREYAKNIVK